MAPSMLLSQATGPVHSCIFICHTYPAWGCSGALHYITPCHWTSSFRYIYMPHISSLGLLMAPYIILPLVTGPVHSGIFICHTYPAWGCSWRLTSYYPLPLDQFIHVYLYVTHIQPRAAHGALHHIIPCHWTSSFMYIYMSHISSLGLLMTPYIILSLVTGPVHSCIFICHTYPAWGCSWRLTSYYTWSLDLFIHVYLYVTHIQPRAAHGALHHIIMHQLIQKHLVIMLSPSKVKQCRR